MSRRSVAVSLGLVVCAVTRIPAAGPAPMPACFVENRGQWPEDVRFSAWGGGSVTGLTRDSMYLRLGAGDASLHLRLVFEGAREDVALEGEGRLAASFCWVRGRDRSRWRSGVPAYSSVLYRGLHDCVDLRVRTGAVPGDGGAFEYDIIVQPGADPEDVAIRCDGAEGLSLDGEGALLVETALGILRQPPPKTWMELPSGGTVPIECRYRLLGDRRFGFEAPGRDASLPTVIDPPLLWCSYLGGNDEDASAYRIAVAKDGSVLTAGATMSLEFPGVLPGQVHAGGDCYATKLSADGSDLEWAIVFGGTRQTSDVSRPHEYLYAIALGDDGLLTATGSTDSSDFPTTGPGAYQESFGGGPNDGFIVRLNPDPGLPPEEQLVYSTYLGGSGEDAIADVAIEPSGSVLVCGYTASSSDFPVTPGAFQTGYGGGAFDAFLARLTLDPALGTDQLAYSTFLGGTREDASPNSFQDRMFFQAIALDETGAVAVAGMTLSPDFPTTPGAYQGTYHPGGDASTNSEVYIVRMRPDASLDPADQLVYATFLGGSAWEAPSALLVDDSGHLTVAGYTSSTDFPTTPGAHDRTRSGQDDLFVARLRPDPSVAPGEQLLYSTFLGGSSNDIGLSMDALDAGAVVLGGYTLSPDFPVTAGAVRPTYGGGYDDGFLSVLVLDAALAAPDQLAYSTYFGGTGIDQASAVVRSENAGVVIAGETSSPNLPVTAGAFQTEFRGGFTLGFNEDAFVASFDLRLPRAASDLVLSGCQACVDGSSSSTPEGTAIVTYAWDFGDGTTAEGPTPPCHTYETPGSYAIVLAVTNDAGLIGTKTHLVDCRCPAGDVFPWEAADIGEPRFQGSSSRDGECLDLCAGGAMLGGSGDTLHFARQEVAGDFSITLRVEAMDGAPLGAQLGLMARASVDAGASMAAISARRFGTGGSTSLRWNARRTPGTAATGRTIVAAELPAWMRLERKADQLSGWFSTDGAVWTEPDGARLSLTEWSDPPPATLLVGVFGVGREPTDDLSAYEALRGRACLEEPAEKQFVRGDSNDDGNVDISDAVHVLGWLFLGGETPGCLAATDTNTDGRSDLSDAIYVLRHLFLGDGPPSAPFPACGTDPSEDGLGCDRFASCP